MTRHSRTIRFCFCFLIAGTMFLQTNASALAYDDELAFRTAAEYLNRGMYLEAMGVYQEASDSSTDVEIRARALLYIATTYSMYLDQPDAALERFDHILRNYPETKSAGDALFNRGMVLYGKEAFAEAREAFAAYIQRYPQGSRFLSAQVWAESAEALAMHAPPPTPPEGALVIRDTVIRILIEQSAREVVLQADQPIKISDPFTGMDLAAQAYRVSILCKENGLTLNGRDVAAAACRFSVAGKPLHYNNHRFRGDMVVTNQNGRLDLINRVPIEEYLYGVVPREMSPSWSSQALMAQAVAARTYALYVKSKSGDKAYDVMATTASQVYGGMDAETVASNRAVDATRGQVMTHDNKLIIAYFHANSGGYTEDPGNVWSAGLPYLKSIRDDYSLDTPGIHWDYFLSFQEAQERLRKSGMDIRGIQGLEMGARTSSGRCAMVRIVTADGKKELTSNNFRIHMGAMNLKSTLFEIQPSKGGVLFKGRGYGHGVGMSQWGAYRMAGKEATYREILNHYYQDIEIVSISS